MPIKDTSAQELARVLGGKRAGERTWVVPGPGHNSRDRSLSLRDTPDGVVWHSFAGDDDANCMDYLLNACGRTNLVSSSNHVPELPSASEQAKVTADIKRAKSLWADGREITPGTPAALYLKSRGILPPYRADLRWHPAVPFGNATHIALIACVRHAYYGQQTGLHATFLTSEGQKRHVHGISRKFDGKIAGSGVWPELHDDILIIAEGIETALSAEAQFGIPAVAALSRAGIMALYLPSSIKRVYIVADNDTDANGRDAGIEQIRRRADELAERRIDVRVFYPRTAKWDANSITTHLMAENRLETVVIKLERKTRPIPDAIAYGRGRCEIGVGSLTHPYLYEAALKNEAGRDISRAHVYIEMCAAAAHNDRSVALDIGGRNVEIIVPCGCAILSQRFIADRWGLSRSAAENFIKQAARHGLLAIRRPLLVDGSPCPKEVPDLIELSVRFPDYKDSNNNQHTNLPVYPVFPSNSQRVDVEKTALAIGYDVYQVAPAAKYYNSNTRRKIYGDNRTEVSNCARSDGLAPMPDAPLDMGPWPDHAGQQSRTMQIPRASEMPWYVVPDGLTSVRATKAPPVIDPVADLADGILPEAPAGMKNFGSKLIFKPKSHGGRPSRAGKLAKVIIR